MKTNNEVRLEITIELEELKVKIMKLNEFLYSPNNCISSTQRKLIQNQERAMELYLFFLKERILDLKEAEYGV